MSGKVEDLSASVGTAGSPSGHGAVLQSPAESSDTAGQHPQEKRGEGSSSNESAYVNQGLQAWLSGRRAWTKKPEGEKLCPKKRRAVTHMSLAQLASPQPYPQPVPLQAVVDLLNDAWELEEEYLKF